MILTKGGATRKIAEEILTDLESANMEDSLLTAQTLIALVFNSKRAADQEWLRKKWNLMRKELRDNWFLQEITAEAREEGREEGREEERKLREEEQKLREEERKQEIERLRQMLFSFVQARFANN